MYVHKYVCIYVRTDIVRLYILIFRVCSYVLILRNQHTIFCYIFRVLSCEFDRTDPSQYFCGWFCS